MLARRSCSHCLVFCGWDWLATLWDPCASSAQLLSCLLEVLGFWSRLLVQWIHSGLMVINLAQYSTVGAWEAPKSPQRIHLGSWARSFSVLDDSPLHYGLIGV
jgi:hypothetical protein